MFAVSTGCLFPLGTAEAVDIFRFYGFDSLELAFQSWEFRFSLEGKLEGRATSAALKVIDESGIRIPTLHAPRLAQDDFHSLTARGDALLECRRIAELLNAHAIVIHPSHVFSDYESSASWLSLSPEERSSADPMQPPDVLPVVSNWPTDTSAHLALENIRTRWDACYTNEASQMEAALDCTGLQMVALDLGHAERSGTLSGFLRRLGDRVVTVQVDVQRVTRPAFRDELALIHSTCSNLLSITIEGRIAVADLQELRSLLAATLRDH